MDTTIIQTIHPFLLEDLEDVCEVEPADWDMLIAQMRWYLSTPYCFPLKAVHGEALFCGLGNALMHQGTGWIGNIHVAPRFRAMGVREKLVRALVAELESRGCTTVSVMAQPEEQAMYEAEGFAIDCAYVMYDEGKCEAPTLDEVELYEPHHALGVLHLDKKASGEDRRVLISEHSYASRIYVEKQRTLANYIVMLGEGLIIAQRPDAGHELLRWLLPMDKRVMIPETNRDAVEFLELRGYKVTRRELRMYRGAKLDWHPEMLYGRISAHLG